MSYLFLKNIKNYWNLKNIENLWKCNWKLFKAHRNTHVPELPFADWRHATLLKKRPCQRYYSVNFVKFLTRPFYKTPTEDLLYFRWSLHNVINLWLINKSTIDLTENNTSHEFHVETLWKRPLSRAVFVVNINSFRVTGLLLYPQKKSENLLLFQGI